MKILYGLLIVFNVVACVGFLLGSFIPSTFSIVLLYVISIVFWIRAYNNKL